MRVGDHWLNTSNLALLKAPPAIIPSETNLMLNPLHTDTAKLRIGTARAFHFDTQMCQSKLDANFFERLKCRDSCN